MSFNLTIFVVEVGFIDFFCMIGLEYNDIYFYSLNELSFERNLFLSLRVEMQLFGLVWHNSCR